MGPGPSEMSHEGRLHDSLAHSSYKIWCKALEDNFPYLSAFTTGEHLKIGIILQSGIMVDFSLFLLFLVFSYLISSTHLSSPSFLFKYHEWLTRGLDRVETSYCLED